MKIAELQKKIADVLGVSASQKELSFEIFVEKISEILVEHITLKVPRVGYFQLKITATKNVVRQLIFSPLSEDFAHDSRNLYLTIDAAPKAKSTPEFDSNIFSIGVGKPLLPLSIDELPDTETSYAMLKKSIEERVKELLMETDQIPNFNIWDDYYNSPSKYEEGLIDETKYQLNELTSDLQFEDEIIPGKIPENISDNFSYHPNDSIESSEINSSNSIKDDINQHENVEKYDGLLPASGKEPDYGSSDILFPPADGPELESFLQITTKEEKKDLDTIVNVTHVEINKDSENAIEIISDEEDYSALLDLELNENSDDSSPISIADLLDDIPPLTMDNPSLKREVTEMEDDVLPMEEVMPRMLAGENDDEKKLATLLDQEINKISDDSMPVSSPNSLDDGTSLIDNTQSMEMESTTTDNVSPTIEEVAPQILTNETDHKKNFNTSLDKELNIISDGSTPISNSDLPDDGVSVIENNQIIQKAEAIMDVDSLPIEEVTAKTLSDGSNDMTNSASYDIQELAKSKSDETDISSGTVKTSESNEENSVGEDTSENKKEDDKIIHDDTTESNNSSFEELHRLSDEVINSSDKEEDSFGEFQPVDEEEEKIEWNWGDELREEFGIPATEQGDYKYDAIKDREEKKESEIEFVDDYLEDETVTKNLFSQLEKTLEREFSYDKEPNHRLTVEEKKPDPERNSLKKVVMEFSGPPAKYEFIEDRPSEKERRMAITLVNEGNTKTSKKFSETDEDITDRSKDSYFGKMFLIIFGAFIVVATVAVFIIINGNNTNQTNRGVQPDQQGNTNSGSDSPNANNLNRSNSSVIDSTAIGYDDLNDFPRTATPPVPIKDATDKQILETIKNETAKLQSSRKVNESPDRRQPNANLTNEAIPQTTIIDTRVSNRIFYNGTNYFLQVSSWPSRGVAEEEIKRLRALGFNAFILEANLPQKGGTWYRVRIGPFKSETETDEFMKKNNL